MCKSKTDNSQNGLSDQTNSNTNVGLINVSDQSFGVTGEQIATYLIAFIVGIMVLKWIRKYCNRKAARNRQMLMDMANNVPLNPMNAAQALPPPAPVHQPVAQQPVVPIVLQHGYKQPAIMMEADSMEYDRMQKYRT